MPSTGSSAYQKLTETLLSDLTAASGGAPVDISRICDLKLKIRLDAPIWSRLEVECETAPGAAPQGAVVDNADAARTALVAEHSETADRALEAEQVRAQLEGKERVLFERTQSGWSGARQPGGRSVIRKCGSCAGAGSFACEACAGRGDTQCGGCAGAGEVDQICASCGDGGGSKSSARAMWDEAQLIFRRKAADRNGDPDCERCGGAGAHKAACEACGGAKRVSCGHCEGSGRLECVDCAGSGQQTDRYFTALRFRCASLIESEPQLSEAAAIKLRQGVRQLAKAGKITPQFEGLRSSGQLHRASYTVELALTAVRVTVGRHSPRVMAEIYAIGEDAMLIDPPPLVDLLHQRALDKLRMSSRDGPRDIADMLSGRALGRAALQAAARRDLRFDAAAFEPLATPSFAARLFELAKISHRHVGWRARRWFWPAAVATAPLAIAALDLTGATSAIAGWTSVAAATSGVDGSIAQNQAAKGALIAARVVELGLWWVTALTVSLLLYRASIRRILGFSRVTSYWDALRAGPTPALGLAAGAALTAFLVSMPPPDPGLVARAGEIAAGVAERRDAARDAERAERESLEGYERWRLIRGEDGTQTAVIDDSGAPRARLSLRCVEGAPRMRMMITGGYERATGGRLSVGVSTNRAALGVTSARLQDGGIEFRISQRAIQALRNGSWTRIEILDGDVRRPIRQFTLDGSADAVARATAACPR